MKLGNVDIVASGLGGADDGHIWSVGEILWPVADPRPVCRPQVPLCPTK